MNDRVLLVRHPPVAQAWKGRCYGSSDMGWSRGGAAIGRALATTLASEAGALVVHSGLTRTTRLARMIAARTGATMLCDGRWRERHFGTWEGRSWNAIWRETGNLMDRMVTHPADFRPGGGETTLELFERAGQAWADLPPAPLVIVIAHGGSIAAALTQHHGRSIHQVTDFIPEPGSISVATR